MVKFLNHVLYCELITLCFIILCFANSLEPEDEKRTKFKVNLLRLISRHTYHCYAQFRHTYWWNCKRFSLKKRPLSDHEALRRLWEDYDICIYIRQSRVPVNIALFALAREAVSVLATSKILQIILR